MFSGPFSKWAKINRIAVDSRSRNTLLKLAFSRYNYPGFHLLRRLFSRFGSSHVTISLRANGTGKQVSLTLRPTESGDVASVFENWVESHSPIDFPEAGPRLIVDAGANIGCYSLYMASLYPECRFIEFEPVQGNAEILRDNLGKNMVNAQVHESALWHQNVDCLFMAPAAANAGFAREGAESGGVAVPGQTLESVLAGDLSEVNLLKMDIEGAEWTVLPDLLQTLPAKCIVWMELHDVVRDPDWLKLQLEQYGWSGVRKESTGTHEMWLLHKM